MIGGGNVGSAMGLLYFSNFALEDMKVFGYRAVGGDKIDFLGKI